MSNFDPNAILRGVQLTAVGGQSFYTSDCDLLLNFPAANRAVLNPQLFRHVHFRQALLAVLAGLTIHLLLMIPVCILPGGLRERT